MGPRRQIKNMTHPTRWGAALVYLAAMAGTLVTALLLKKAVFVLPCIAVQAVALFWYMLSYIPFGRKMVTTCCKNALNDV